MNNEEKLPTVQFRVSMEHARIIAAVADEINVSRQTIFSWMWMQGRKMPDLPFDKAVDQLTKQFNNYMKTTVQEVVRAGSVFE